nr:hypothetical protein GCM10020092_036230 [Actinoplanes digitatis]
MRGSKVAFVEIEVLKARFEVDVQPFTSGGAGLLGRGLDQRGTYAVLLSFGIDGGVEEESVAAAVPADLDEPDEPSRPRRRRSR